jgi:hypothetical protein
MFTILLPQSFRLSSCSALRQSAPRRGHGPPPEVYRDGLDIVGVDSSQGHSIFQIAIIECIKHTFPKSTLLRVISLPGSAQAGVDFSHISPYLSIFILLNVFSSIMLPRSPRGRPIESSSTARSLLFPCGTMPSLLIPFLDSLRRVSGNTVVLTPAYRTQSCPRPLGSNGGQGKCA